MSLKDTQKYLDKTNREIKESREHPYIMNVLNNLHDRIVDLERYAMMGDQEIKYNTKGEIIFFLSTLDFIQGRINTSEISGKDGEKKLKIIIEIGE